MADISPITSEVLAAKEYAAYLKGVYNAKSVPASSYGAAFDGDKFMRSMDLLARQTEIFDITSTRTIVKAINDCPQVSTILFRKGQAHSNGKSILVDDAGNALEGPKARLYQRLIDKPNIFENRASFKMRQNIFLGSFGWYFEYLELPLGMGPEFIQRRILDPRFCDIQWKHKTLFGVTDPSELIIRFQYTENGATRVITDLENLFIYRHPNVMSVNNGILPESPLKTLKYPINNSIINYKSRNRLIKKPFGVLSGDKSDNISNIPLTAKERLELNRTYRESYGTEFDDQEDLIIASSRLNFTPFMPPIKDMQLLELLKSDSAVICDVMGYEYDLLARDLGGVALNNKREAGKNLYQNHIIPESRNQDEQESDNLRRFISGINVRTTFDHLDVMQEDKKQSSEALRNDVQALVLAFKNNQCTYDAMVKRIGLSEPQGKWIGKYWADLSDEDRALFEKSSNNNSSNADQANNPEGANQ